MAVAEVEQLAVEAADAGVDPGLVAPGRGAGAAVDHGVEIAVDPDLEAVGRAPCGRGAARHGKPSSGRTPRSRGSTQNRRRIVGVLRHREDAGRIGPKQDLGRDLDASAAVHGLQRASGSTLLDSAGFQESFQPVDVVVRRSGCPDCARASGTAAGSCRRRRRRTRRASGAGASGTRCGCGRGRSACRRASRSRAGSCSPDRRPNRRARRGRPADGNR